MQTPKEKLNRVLENLKQQIVMGKQKPQRHKENAEVLANFYSSVFTREPDGDIPQLEECQIQYPFTESKFEESEVRKLLLGINPSKSPGPDGLHPKAFKELTNVIIKRYRDKGKKVKYIQV